MRAIIIIAVAAIAGFFGYQYFANGKAPVEAVEAVTEQAETAVEEAADTATAATEAAVETATKAAAAAEGAADAATEAATAATDAATSALGSVAAALDPAVLLNVETLDAAAVVTYIEASSLEDGTKGTLITAVNAAGDNPELIQGVIDQIKAALGL